MANEDSALKEVDQELAEEHQWAMFRKYGPLAIAGAASIILAVGGWQYWNASQDKAAGQTALEFRNAVDLIEENVDEGRVALLAIEEDGAAGYSILAALHRAASFARGGERLAAINIYREIYNDGAAPKEIRGLARLRAGYLSISDGRDEVMIDIGDLLNGGSAYAYQAREISGLAALKAEDYETALSMFRLLSVDIGASVSLRERAQDFTALAQAAKDGVNITGEMRLDDILTVVCEIIEDNEVNDENTTGQGVDETNPESIPPVSTKDTTDTPPANSENE